jgi:hypothetical protein
MEIFLQNAEIFQILQEQTQTKIKFCYQNTKFKMTAKFKMAAKTEVA